MINSYNPLCGYMVLYAGNYYSIAVIIMKVCAYYKSFNPYDTDTSTRA